MSHGAPTPPPREHQRELDAIAARYQRRAVGDRYSPLRPEVWQAMQERQRALLRLLAQHAPRPLAELRVLEVGCGGGANLLELLRLGFAAEHLVGNELLPERAAQARRQLPALTAVHAGDATALDLPAGGFDLVVQSTVFSSILDDGVQQRLAERMWHWVKPGGAVLWYDFTVDNPRNPDVRGVPRSRVGALFPQARPQWRRVTLAPPLARALCALHPALYPVANALPVLRTHLLAWLEKPAS